MTILSGMSGTNPRDFLAALGLLRISSRSHSDVRLSFREDRGYAPEICGIDGRDLAELVSRDAASQAGPQPWRLEYKKSQKRGTIVVADLKAPPGEFREFMSAAIQSWIQGKREGAAYAAAFATDVAVDGKGNTKPTAFHFTAANQQFLDTVEKIRSSIDRTWCEEALFAGHAERPGQNLRWDPAADRAYALMAANPVTGGTSVTAPLEWLAFRALPLMPVLPRGRQAETTGVRGRGDAMQFRWPLWSPPASLATAMALVRMNWWQDRIDRTSLGVIAICTSAIRRTGQGFGNLGPAEIAV
jgi:hypothetical protein